MYLDYCQDRMHNVISYITFENQISISYFHFDQEILPNNVYFDKINMINISTENFFVESCLQKSPVFFDSNIISDKQIKFLHQVTFHNCYFPSQIQTYGEAIIISTTTIDTHIIRINTKICNIFPNITCEHKSKMQYPPIAILTFFNFFIIFVS